jgi:hypothetical protein
MKFVWIVLGSCWGFSPWWCLSRWEGRSSTTFSTAGFSGVPSGPDSLPCG